jgi:hypothetical protein
MHTVSCSGRVQLPEFERIINHSSQRRVDVLLQIPLDLADVEARIKAGHSLRDDRL